MASQVTYSDIVSILFIKYSDNKYLSSEQFRSITLYISALIHKQFCSMLICKENFQELKVAPWFNRCLHLTAQMYLHTVDTLEVVFVHCHWSKTMHKLYYGMVYEPFGTFYINPNALPFNPSLKMLCIPLINCGCGATASNQRTINHKVWKGFFCNADRVCHCLQGLQLYQYCHLVSCLKG